MSKKFIAAVVIGFACISGIAADDQSEKCTEVGIICNKENTKIQMCPKKDAAPILVRDCSKEDKTCVKHQNGTVICSDDAAGEQGNNFDCLSEGEFPDPLNCKTSYICEKNQKKPKEKCVCNEKDLYILPVMGMPCVNSDKCPRKAIKCEKEGQIGDFTALDGTPYKYKYYCKAKPKVSSFESEGRTSPPFKQESKKCSPVK